MHYLLFYGYSVEGKNTNKNTHCKKKQDCKSRFFLSFCMCFFVRLRGSFCAATAINLVVLQIIVFGTQHDVRTSWRRNGFFAVLALIEKGVLWLVFWLMQSWLPGKIGQTVDTNFTVLQISFLFAFPYY